MKTRDQLSEPARDLYDLMPDDIGDLDISLGSVLAGSSKLARRFSSMCGAYGDVAGRIFQEAMEAKYPRLAETAETQHGSRQP